MTIPDTENVIDRNKLFLDSVIKERKTLNIWSVFRQSYDFVKYFTL